MKEGKNISLAEWSQPLLEIISNIQAQDFKGNSIVTIDNLEDAKMLKNSLEQFISIIEGESKQ